MNIKWKLLLPVLFILALTGAQIYLIVNMNSTRQADTERVNLAGRQRMLSQKMAKETLAYLMTGDQAHTRDLAATAELFDKSLQALISGGRMELSGRQVNIRPTRQAEITAALREAEQYWNKYRPLFQEAAGQIPGGNQGIGRQVNEASLDLLKRFDAITGMYEKSSADAASSSMTLIYAGLVFYLLLALLAWYFARAGFIKPILRLCDEADRIAAGDLSGR